MHITDKPFHSRLSTLITLSVDEEGRCAITTPGEPAGPGVLAYPLFQSEDGHHRAITIIALENADLAAAMHGSMPGSVLRSVRDEGGVLWIVALAEDNEFDELCVHHGIEPGTGKVQPILLALRDDLSPVIRM
ncbi:protein of unknown function (plasmid) [Magnetospirillum sp. XM-1]|uniref:hypothetical protein n=1 Tax=unclassified Magnetospirillum TaxID=2617991 RepID=UPI00073DCE9D|nr:MULTISPECIES: hypothetical protein [unclassified Magnetospirillum]ARJ66119.1 hypothetical protein WV31_10815 [Magnetospirillum sp. ME-1]CUW41894.1 protein of unknown function [Magnetospirillum sp. XM-1]